MDQLFEQNRDEVTICYTAEAMQVCLNIKLDNHLCTVFKRTMRQVVGVKACELDTSVNCLSENTCFLVYFQDRPGAAHRRLDVQREIRTRAEQFVKWSLAIPGQQSLF